MTGKTLAIGIGGATLSVAMLALGFLAGSGSAPAIATTNTPTNMEAPSQAQIETVVRNYLISNPEILIEMQAALEAKQAEAQRVAQGDVISSAASDIFNSARDGVLGNPNGSVTIVEFFDYNCGFCKRAHQDMEALIKSNPDLRFVLKELPILGPDSQKAHIVSMAFQKLAPEKYGDFHRELLLGGKANEATAIRAALALGVEEDALRREMQDPAILASFEKAYELASRLSINGTPSYVVGEEVVFGALGEHVLNQKIEQVRATN